MRNLALKLAKHLDSIEQEQGPCRVATGDCSPVAPTDPDVPNSGIRLLGLDVRYVA